MKIGVFGAGASGLPAIRHAVEEGHEVVCFERTAHLGGCWSGDGRVGDDDLGNHITSGMYAGLTTNLPKEIMVFGGLAHARGAASFVGQAEVLAYLRAYAKKYRLERHIRFGQEVTSVTPLSAAPRTRWRLTVRDRTTPDAAPTTHDFDALMVAPGHFVYAYTSPIEGADLFAGAKLHSNDYRNAGDYAKRRVLVIGAGPSGGDIAKRVARHATTSFQSVRTRSERFVPVHEDVVEKCEVARFDAAGAHFVDGTYERLDVVIFATGYTYDVPCLTPECGIRIDGNWFKHVYRHCVNVERPSMAVIGLPYGASLFPLVDLQVRYYMAYLAGKFQLPSKEAMLASVEREHAERKSRGMPDRAFHSFPDCARAISADMAKEAGVAPTPNVVFNIMDSLRKSWNDRDVFEIVDDDTFNRIPPK